MIEPNTQVRTQGTGFLVSDDGYIITNNHVVNDATQFEVVTSDGRTHAAKIIETDPQTDLAWDIPLSALPTRRLASAIW